MNSLDDSDYFKKSAFNFYDTFDHFETIYSGENSPSVIYRAIRGFKRFTVKGLKPEYQDDPYFIAQLRKEWEIGYSIDHFNIARYYSFEKIKGKGYCIIREWIDGEVLDKYIEKSRLLNNRILLLLDELCDALEYLHKHQIVHGDLKPSNILVTNDGDHLKIIDFGFSDSPAYASMKLAGGTKNFASPEQKGETEFFIGSKSDLYSLGKVIESLNFKKSHKLKRLIPRLISLNPDNRPELDEIREFLKRSQHGRSFNLKIWLPAILFSFLFILIWRNNEKQERNIYLNQEDELPVTNLERNTPIEQESLEKVKNEKPKKEKDPAVRQPIQKEKRENEETEELRQIPKESNSKEVRMDVHPLEIITYNQTLLAAKKNYSLYPDSIKDWKEATQKEIVSWLQKQINNDEALEGKCLEAMEKGLSRFESTKPGEGSN